MKLTGIALLVAALALWGTAFSLGRRSEGMDEYRRFEKYTGQKEDDADGDDAMLRKDISAIKTFARKLGMAGSVLAVLGCIMLIL